MNPKNNEAIDRNLITKKTFSYRKGDVSINFTLRIDMRTELENAREILVEAINDFDDELIKIPHNIILGKGK